MLFVLYCLLKSIIYFMGVKTSLFVNISGYDIDLNQINEYYIKNGYVESTVSSY